MNFKFHDERGNEVWVNDSGTFAQLVRAGKILPDTLMFDGQTALWKRADDYPEFSAAVSAARAQQYAGAPSYGAPAFGGVGGYEPYDYDNKRVWPLALSLVLLVIGLGLLILSIVKFAGSPFAAGYRVGLVLGNALLFAIVSFVVWRFPLQKKKGMGLLIFACCFFASAVYHSAAVGMEARSTQLAADDVTAMVSEMLNTGELSSRNFDEKKYGTAAPMVKLVREYIQQVISDFTNMNQELEALHVEALLQRETLKDAAHIDEGQARLQSMLAILDRYEELLRQRQEELPEKVNASKMSESVKRDFLIGFNQSKEPGLQKLTEFFNIERTFVSKADDLLNFVRSRIGRYRFVGNNILFNSTRDAETFNGHVEQIALIGKQEDDWRTHTQAASRQQLEKVRKDLGK